jgi:hypothetical protein
MVTGSDALRLYKGNITLFHGTNDSDEDDDEDSSDGQLSGAASDGNESDSGNDAGKPASAADKDKVRDWWLGRRCKSLFLFKQQRVKGIRVRLYARYG